MLEYLQVSNNQSLINEVGFANDDFIGINGTQNEGAAYTLQRMR